MRPRMWPACSSMTRKTWCRSAGPSPGEASSTVAVEPLTAASGVRGSWLTNPRNSARGQNSSSRGARSCAVTTTEATAPSSPWIGVAFNRIDTLRPSGAEKTIAPARTVPAFFGSSVGASSSRGVLAPRRRTDRSRSPAAPRRGGPAYEGVR